MNGVPALFTDSIPGLRGCWSAPKTNPRWSVLQVQFQAHSIERRYVALVDGVISERGTLSTRGRHPRDRKRFTSGRGAKAVTHYQVMERLPGATLVELRLETGRTHQIRVHLSEQGFPILGDPSRSPVAPAQCRSSLPSLPTRRSMPGCSALSIRSRGKAQLCIGTAGRLPVGADQSPRARR